jgi:outer membrane receptor for ferrienterochelin and colicins
MSPRHNAARFAACLLSLLGLVLVAAFCTPAWAQSGNSSLTVTSRQRSTFEASPRRTTSVDREDIRRNGGNTLDEVLAEMPGMQLLRPTGLSVAAIVDGLPQGHVVVLIDGIPAARADNTRLGPSVDLSSLPINPAQIRRIDVYRGTGPAGSGEVGGVIINIVTDNRSDALRLDLGARGGAVSSGFLSQRYFGGIAAPLGDNFGIHLDSQVMQSQAVDVDIDGRPDLPDLMQWQVEGGFRFSRRSNRSLTLQTSYNSADATRRALTRTLEDEIRAEEPISLNGLDNLITRQTRSNSTLTGNWLVNPDLRVEHTTQVRHTEVIFERERIRDGEIEPNNTTRETLFRQTVVASIFRGDHTIQPETVLSAQDARRSGVEDEPFVTSLYAAGAGGTWNWDISPQWQWNSRAYGEYHNLFGAGGVASTGLSWTPADEFTLRASVARTRRVPLAEEMYFRFDHSEVGYIIEGNPSLLPEELTSLRMGPVFRFDAGSDERPFPILFEAEVFYNDVQQAVGVDVVTTANGTSAAVFQYINNGTVRSAGMNSSAQLPNIPGGLSLEFSWAWLPYSDVLAENSRLALTSLHQARAELRGSWLQDRLQVFTDIRGRTEIAVPEGTPAGPAYAQWGIGATVVANDEWTITLQGENLNNTTNPTWGPAPGRSVFLGIEYQFQRERND